MTVKISHGNMKVGSIPNLSLTPGISCSAEACKTCLVNGCYACKAYRMYRQTRAAWNHNTELAQNDLTTFESDLTRYFSSLTAPRFFRIHVGGDFISKGYAEMWARVAAAAPHTAFLTFTKQWDHVRGVDFPANFSLVLSDWPGIEIPADLREKYAVAWIDDGRDCIPETALECPGNCETCGACWALAQKKQDVKFKKH